jgi:hypothetical protein
MWKHIVRHFRWKWLHERFSSIILIWAVQRLTGISDRKKSLDFFFVQKIMNHRTNWTKPLIYVENYKITKIALQHKGLIFADPDSGYEHSPKLNLLIHK